MRSIFNARTVLNIGQQQLADYLSVPRTQVALAETGARQLSDIASQKLGFLEIILQQPNLPESETLLQQENERQNQEAIAALQKHAEDCRYQLRGLLKKQETLRLLQRQATNSLHGIAKVKAMQTTGSEGVKDKKWAAVIEDEALLQLGEANATKLALLAIKIKGLQAEIKEAEAFTKTLMAGNK